MELKQATKDLHHAAEAHPIGKAMANGTITPEWWADWISALYVIHSVIDPKLPESMRRTEQLRRDLEEVAADWILPEAAINYARDLITRAQIEGAAYVFTGAHLMGGAITAKAVGDRLPTHHLQWEDRQAAVRDWKPLRENVGIQKEAVAGFQAVLDILREILANRAQV